MRAHVLGKFAVERFLRELVVVTHCVRAQKRQAHNMLATDILIINETLCTMPIFTSGSNFKIATLGRCGLTGSPPIATYADVSTFVTASLSSLSPSPTSGYDTGVTCPPATSAPTPSSSAEGPSTASHSIPGSCSRSSIVLSSTAYMEYTLEWMNRRFSLVTSAK